MLNFETNSYKKLWAVGDSRGFLIDREYITDRRDWSKSTDI